MLVVSSFIGALYFRWCGPCKAIAPVFADTAAKNTDIQFLKIDVDENGSTSGDVSCRCRLVLRGLQLYALAMQAKITGVPTFIGFAGGSPIGQFSGASAAQLSALVAKVKAK